jgi:hypothetical protein
MILCRCCGAYAEGKLTLLFPNALLDKVRIKAGQTPTLPPQQMQLMAAKPHCHEHFLVLVSQKARDFSGLSPKRVDGWMELHPADMQPVDAAAIFAIDVLP